MGRAYVTALTKKPGIKQRKRSEIYLKRIRDLKPTAASYFFSLSYRNITIYQTAKNMKTETSEHLKELVKEKENL